MRLLAGPAAVFVLVVASACGGGGGGNFPTASSGGGGETTDSTPGAPVPTLQPAGPAAAASCAQEAASGATISMEGTHNLNPADETIKAGESVTFTNNSKTNHHIRFDGGPDCGFTLIGKSVSVTFANAGSYSYVCTIHPTFMKGTITVQ